MELARAISGVVRERGAVADPGAVQEVQLAIAAKPDAIDLPFWRAVLGYAPMHDDNCIDPLGQGSRRSGNIGMHVLPQVQDDVGGLW